jgi:hypothetical protein
MTILMLGNQMQAINRQFLQVSRTSMKIIAQKLSRYSNRWSMARDI